MQATEVCKGIEPEVAAVLDALIRAMRPRVVVESGSFPGISTLAILNALEENGEGWLWAFEPNPAYREVLERSLTDRPVTLSTADPTLDVAQLTFIDSSPYGTRNREIEAWQRLAREGAVLVVHDICDSRWVQPRWMTPGVRLSTPWGVGIFQKPGRWVE